MINWLRYIIIFLISLGLVLPTVLFNIPQSGSIGMIIFGVFVGIVLSIGSYTIISFRKVSMSLEGNTKEILNRIYLKSILILTFIIMRVIAELNLAKIFLITDQVNRILGAFQFALIVLYFYIVYDIVKHLKTLPKVYDSSRRTSRLQEDVKE